MPRIRSDLEYQATAMLLGMEYMAGVHAFVVIPDDPQVPIRYWDADNLRELTVDDVTIRGNEAFDKGVRS
jgi:hypothetical protein